MALAPSERYGAAGQCAAWTAPTGVLHATLACLAIGNRGTRYVGQTRATILQRWRKHISDLRRNVHHNTPLQEVYNRGERFVIIPLEAVPRDSPPWFFDQREQYWIDWAGVAAVNVAW